MAQGDKSAYYRALKDAGYEFDRHYREYTTEQLAALAGERELNVDLPAAPGSLPTRREDDGEDLRAQIASLTQTVAQLAQLITPGQRRAESAARPVAAAAEKLGAPGAQPGTPRPAALDPNQHAGVTQNSHADDEVIEVDAQGNQWYQKEVAKPAFAKPRGRRVLRYQDAGVRTEQITTHDGYVETFEVSGDPRNARPAEIKVTLPSYQTGIYKAPDMPFKIHTYRGAAGFDLRDVEAYYGGADLVPHTVKRMYVSNDLCYDIQTTIRTIENEYRERVLRAEKGIYA